MPDGHLLFVHTRSIKDDESEKTLKYTTMMSSSFVTTAAGIAASKCTERSYRGWRSYWPGYWSKPLTVYDRNHFHISIATLHRCSKVCPEGQ